MGHAEASRFPRRLKAGAWAALMKPLVQVGLLALGPALGLGIARFAYGLLLPPMRDDLGWSYSQAGWINTINAIGYIVGAMTAASVTQRLGAARTYGLGAFLTVAAVLALGFTDSFTTLSLLRLLSGVSGAFIFVAGGTMAANLAANHTERRGVIVGLFYAGAGFGIAISGLIVPYWIQIFGITGWRTAWLLLGATGLVFAAAGYLAAAPSGFRSQTKSTHVRYRPLTHRWILAGYAAFGAGSIGYMTFMVAHLKASAQPSWHVSAFCVVIGLSAMAAPWLWSRLLMRSRQAHAFATLVGINALGAAIPLISMSFPAVMTSAVIFGAVFFAVVAATTNFVQYNVAPASRASAIGTFTVLFGLGQSIGPFAIGMVTDTTGSLHAGLTIGFGLIAFGAAISLMQNLNLHRKRG
jgi:predicted MFS family arabinose efflux permease